MDGRTCTQCCQWKCADEFYLVKKTGKLNSWCIPCYRAKHLQRYQPKVEVDLHQNRTCQWCGSTYLPQIRKPSQFCSRKCKDQALKKARYEDKDSWKTCSVAGCDRRMPSGTYCNMHAWRLANIGELGPAGRMTQVRNNRNADGYVVFERGGKAFLEHRMVMEQLLGRPLWPFENVHHKNGIRDDNRPENLELWVHPQPKGQRPEDLAVWVVETYPVLVRAALEGRPVHLF